MVTEEKAVQLLPCPCCGSADVEVIESYSYGSPVFAVVCPDCPVRTNRSCGKEYVVEAWNRREISPVVELDSWIDSELSEGTCPEFLAAMRKVKDKLREVCGQKTRG